MDWMECNIMSQWGTTRIGSVQCNFHIFFFCSITVDNTYENIDNVGEILTHATNEDDFEPEETYIVPNSVKTVSNNQNNTATANTGSSQGNLQSVQCPLKIIMLPST